MADSSSQEETMKAAFQEVIDNTEQLMEAIGRMDWDKIEDLGDHIAGNARVLKVLSRVN